MSTAARIDELLSKFDENPRRYFAPLANEYRKAGDLTQAIALCREHLPKQPGHMSGHIVFGQALYEHGDLIEAQSVFEAALALDPENLIALRHLGDISRGRGDTASARRWYGRVLEADPRNDDIAALLAALPTQPTPGATRVVASEALPVVDEPSTPHAPAFIDEPAWHTPAILGAPSEPAPQEMTARAEPDLLDLDSPVDPMIEVPTFFGDVSAKARDLETAPLDEAFGAEPEISAGFDAAASDAPAVPPMDDVAFEALHIEEVDEGAAESDADAPALGDAFENALPHDSLSDAIGAFETYDPLDSVSAPGSDAHPHVWPAAPAETEPSPTMSESVAEYGDGLDDIEWPDATQLAARTPSPARSATPVAPWSAVAAAPALDESESLLDEPSDADEAPAPVESLVDVPSEAEEPPAPVESLVESFGEDDEAPAPIDSLVEVPSEAEEPPAPFESLVESFGEDDEAPAPVESLVESFGEDDEALAPIESLVESFGEDDEAPAPVESLVEVPSEAEEPPAPVETLVEPFGEDDEAPAPVESFGESFGEHDEVPPPVESLVEVPREAEEPIEPEFTSELATASSVDDVERFDAELADLADLEPSSPIDEDPPFSAGEMPWLMSTEEEREAEEADLYEATAELPESPAFVTETMAELFVSQGFVTRAIGVYEELVSRRPDDRALASRLAELQASLAPESVESALEATEPHAVEATEQEAEEATEQPHAVEATQPSFLSTPIAPLAAFTPVRSGTPQSVPFIAPAPRRTAREWFSLLASMQVARRTPAVGHVMVSMPTPADGLASLFGAAPLPVDDVAARSLATAYGSAVPLDSSTPLFASGEFTLPPDAPRETVSTSPAEPTNGPGAYSFDRFFPDPATTANGPSASSDAPTATTPSASSSDESTTSPSADLAQFSHWLKGLSNS